MNIHSLYRPFMRYFRTRRMQQFCDRFSLTEATQVLDIGGDSFNWTLISTAPFLTIANLYSPRERERTLSPGLLPMVVIFPLRTNLSILSTATLIEHLGNIRDQQLFANECQRVGRRYYVQTPNKRFPVEPHLLTPFIHWLPRRWQKRLLRFTVWGLVTRPSPQECARFIQQVRLLDEQELRRLFPEAAFWRERTLGLVKSLIAVKI